MRRMVMSRALVFVLSALAATILLAAQAHTTRTTVLPAENDNFENATIVGRLPFAASASLANAGLESSEPPYCLSPENTVWYRMTPDTDTILAIKIRTERFLTLGAFVGDSLADLSVLACGYEVFDESVQTQTHADLMTAQLYAGLRRGTTYYIQIGLLSADEPADTEYQIEFAEGLEADTTCDGSVDARDALAIFRTNVEGNFPLCPAAGDLNCREGLAIDDAMATLRKLAGLPYDGLLDCQPRKQAPI